MQHIQNSTANATMVYNKMRQVLLQNATFITKCVGTMDQVWSKFTCK